jgi:hypothetical protein
MDGTMFQGVDLAPGPVVTSLEGGGGGEKKWKLPKPEVGNRTWI